MLREMIFFNLSQHLFQAPIWPPKTREVSILIFVVTRFIFSRFKRGSYRLDHFLLFLFQFSKSKSPGANSGAHFFDETFLLLKKKNWPRLHPINLFWGVIYAFCVTNCRVWDCYTLCLTPNSCKQITKC
jgi:hypothetical protein